MSSKQNQPGGGKVYAVASGKQPGLYNSWDAAKANTNKVSGAVHKSFKSESEASAWMDGYSKAQYGGTTPAYSKWAHKGY